MKVQLLWWNTSFTLVITRATNEWSHSNLLKVISWLNSVCLMVASNSRLNSSLSIKAQVQPLLGLFLGLAWLISSKAYVYQHTGYTITHIYVMMYTHNTHNTSSFFDKRNIINYICWCHAWAHQTKWAKPNSILAISSQVSSSLLSKACVNWSRTWARLICSRVITLKTIVSTKISNKLNESNTNLTKLFKWLYIIFPPLHLNKRSPWGILETDVYKL